MNKSSAVAEMGNRLAAIDKGWKVAAVVSLSVGGAEFPSITMWPGPRATSVPSGILIHPAVWHNRHGPKSWGCCAPYFWGRWVTPHLTHCRRGRGLPPYQVASWSIQPFGHNTPPVSMIGFSDNLFRNGWSHNLATRIRSVTASLDTNKPLLN